MQRQWSGWRPAAAAAGVVLAAAAWAQPANDACANATIISGIPFFDFGDNSTATADGPQVSCNPSFVTTIENSVWWRFDGPPAAQELSLAADGSGFSEIIALFQGPDCASLTELACVDRSRALIDFTAQPGETYWIVIGDFAGTPGGGIFDLSLDVRPPAPPHDDCANAAVLAPNGFASGTNISATTDGVATCAPDSHADVWYEFTPAASGLHEIGTCTFAQFDTVLSVHIGCPGTELTQIACEDNFDGDGCGVRSKVRANLEAGRPYLVRVAAAQTDTVPGDFTVDVTGPLTPAGACCLGNGGCQVIDESFCGILGGVYQGDSVPCGGAQYALTLGGEPFEDIAPTGTPLTLGDDDSAMIPIGFSFPFFGQMKTSVEVASNGYLAFSGDAGEFRNTSIPSTVAPNEIIAPLWDDFNLTQGGSAMYEVRGAAGSQRLIVQWNAVPQHLVGDANTFQAALFESGRIEFRYAAVTPENPFGDYTIGLEDATGTRGFGAAGTGVTGGMSLRFDPFSEPDSCGAACLCELDGDGAQVNVFDLLAYLDLWFAGDAAADVDGAPGVDVFDLLAFLDCWFPASAGGC